MVSRAAGKGANVVRNAVRAAAPVYKGKVGKKRPELVPGALKRGITRDGERSKIKGKKVYKIVFDSKKNKEFQREIKQPHKAGGKNGHAYYPASIEYGFLTRANEGGGLKFVKRVTGTGLKYVEGTHFMRDAAEASSQAAKKTMIDTLMAELEKEWTK